MKGLARPAGDSTGPAVAIRRTNRRRHASLYGKTKPQDIDGGSKPLNRVFVAVTGEQADRQRLRGEIERLGGILSVRCSPTACCLPPGASFHTAVRSSRLCIGGWATCWRRRPQCDGRHNGSGKRPSLGCLYWTGYRGLPSFARRCIGFVHDLFVGSVAGFYPRARPPGRSRRCVGSYSMARHQHRGPTTAQQHRQQVDQGFCRRWDRTSRPPHRDRTQRLRPAARTGHGGAGAALDVEVATIELTYGALGRRFAYEAAGLPQPRTMQRLLCAFLCDVLRALR